MRKITDSIGRFGFVNSVLVDGAGQGIAVYGRLEAANYLELAEMPILPITHLSAAEKRAYSLADKQLRHKAGWDKEILATELQASVDFKIELTAFELSEIDLILDEDRARKSSKPEAADLVPEVAPGLPITRLVDVWKLGAHRLICGDAREFDALARLLVDAEVDMIFTDPSYNVKVDGHVSGLGKVKHYEFAFGLDEMSEAKLTVFLREAMARAAAHCRDGAIAYVFVD